MIENTFIVSLIKPVGAQFLNVLAGVTAGLASHRIGNCWLEGQV